MKTYSVLKKYALFTLVLGLFSLFLVLMLKSRISDNSVSPETERVYKVPQRREIEISSNKHGAKVRRADASTSQHKAQEGLLLPPPQQDPHFKKIERIKEIEALFEERAGKVIRNPLKILEMLKLEAEMRKLGQEIRSAARQETHAIENEELFDLKIAQLVLPNLTPDGRLPVSIGEVVVDLLVESGDIDGAATIYMATQRAIENGDEFFAPEQRWRQPSAAPGWTAEQDFSEDPCCPEEATQALLEDEHRHDLSASQLPTPVAAKSIEAEMSERLSPERFDKAQQLMDEYGTAEGLRRLRESDPEAARRFEQRFEQGLNPEPSRDAPKGRTHPDGQSPDDSP